MKDVNQNVSEDMLLVKRMKDNDKAAFEMLFNKYLNHVKKVVQNTSAYYLSKEDKEEVVADVFISIWKTRQRLDAEKTTLQPYIATIAKNMTLNKNQANAKYSAVVEVPLEASGKKNEEINNVIQKEIQNIIMASIRQFSQDEILCFIKFYYYAMTTSEIAKELKINENTVKSKLARGRKKLKIMLEERGIHDEYFDF